MKKLRYPAILQIFSVLAVFGLKRGLAEGAYFSLYYAVLFGHFLIAFYYSGGTLRGLLGSRRMSPGFAVLMFAAAALSLWGTVPVLVSVVGLHNALSEAYAPDALGIRNGRSAALRFALSVSVYFGLVSGVPVLALSIALLAALCFAERELRASERIARVLGDGLGVALLALLPPRSVTFQDAVFYHCVYWFLFGAVRAASEAPGRPLPRYLAVTGAVTLACLSATPWLKWVPEVGYREWSILTTKAGFIHIVLALGLSRANPGWVYRLFAPIEAVASPQR